MKQDYGKLFAKLDETLAEFLAEVDRKRLADMATSEWRVKDVLGHITYWHEYYAQQYIALARGATAYVHRSLAGKNEAGRKQMKSKPKTVLVRALLEAHENLRKCIVVGRVPSMRYMKSREYTTSEFLEVVSGHIQRHTVQVRRAKPASKGV